MLRGSLCLQKITTNYLFIQTSTEIFICLFSCNFHWIAGEWEPCSATCGSRGTQQRELYCVPQSVLSEAVYSNNNTVLREVWRFMVSPTKCPGIRPGDTRPCNRIPCLSYWMYDEWSQVPSSWLVYLCFVFKTQILVLC